MIELWLDFWGWGWELTVGWSIAWTVLWVFNKRRQKVD